MSISHISKNPGSRLGGAYTVGIATPDSY